MDFIELFKVCLLAVFQGIAEFLPISSSGHLQVLQYLLGINPEGNLFLGVLLHAGTLLAILIFYFHSLWNILKKQQYKLIIAVIIGSIPAAIVGITIKKSGYEEMIFGSLLIPAIGFAITATMLLFAMKSRTPEQESTATPIENISLKQALLIGTAQAIAIAPGISRSGSTISAGLKFNLKKEDCAQFSFLLAIPAIGGAILLEAMDVIKEKIEFESSQIIIFVIGFLLSAVVGYFSLKVLLGMLRKGNLQIFAWYLYCASIFTIGLWGFDKFIK